jgi:hypothetical protein
MAKTVKRGRPAKDREQVASKVIRFVITPEQQHLIEDGLPEGWTIHMLAKFLLLKEM